MGALGLGRVPRRRHGPRQDHPAPGVPAASQKNAREKRPALLVAPTSVLGNWEREAERFAPACAVVRHYGSERAREAEDIPKKAGTLVVTSYGLLRRDAAAARRPSSGPRWRWTRRRTSRTRLPPPPGRRARCAPRHRFALTGTPVENRLAELWSIFEFANPGLLGPLEQFRRNYAVPIERYGDDEAAARAAADRGSVPAAPAQERPEHHPGPAAQERDEDLLHADARAGDAVPGGGRRGDASHRVGRRHRAARPGAGAADVPQADLQPSGAVPGRSRAAPEPVRQARAHRGDARGSHSGRRQGARVHAVSRDGRPARSSILQSAWAWRSLFLHGGTPQKARDEMVRRFQEEPHGAAGVRALGQGGRHRPEPDGGEPRVPLRSLVEPGGGRSSDGPRLPHRPEALGPGSQAGVRRHRGGKGRSHAGAEARSGGEGGGHGREVDHRAGQRRPARSVRAVERRGGRRRRRGACSQQITPEEAREGRRSSSR